MKPKAYRVTFIKFEFSGVDDVTEEEMDEAVDEALSNVWYADDEDDLVEEITAATGWCINSIDYDHILK